MRACLNVKDEGEGAGSLCLSVVRKNLGNFSEKSRKFREKTRKIDVKNK
jgi:hypothetical protein